jgi:hypothetical protein
MSLGWNGLILRLFIDVRRWFTALGKGQVVFCGELFVVRVPKPEAVLLVFLHSNFYMESLVRLFFIP